MKKSNGSETPARGVAPAADDGAAAGAETPARGAAAGADDGAAAVAEWQLSRRAFLGGTAAAAGVYLAGCAQDVESAPAAASAAAAGPVGDRRIVRAAIHPGIGVARVGNSTAEDGWFIGPEVTEPALTEAGQSRDAAGALKRQAARFRIYGYNAAGEVVRELGAGDAEIEWRVHLANKKAAWYRFLVALDIPEAAELRVPRRNAGVTGAERRGLVIDPGPRVISGAGTAGPAYQFDTGSFQGTPVPLGELRTDEQGRLLVLGGPGKSGSPAGLAVFDPGNWDTFNNADGWYDDISDGPVSARVLIGGREIPVEPAWVVVGPPNYAPDVIGWRTLYDLLVDTYVQCGWLRFPETTSFSRDVLPALRRLSGLQWVNKGFLAGFGKGSRLDFDDPAFVARLAHRPEEGAPDTHAELRQLLFNCFRPADNAVEEPRSWPWMYGDAYGSFAGSPHNNLALSEVRARHLRRWVEGDFVADWEPGAQPPRRIDEVPLAGQPAMLDQAALHFCLADAFHPGCELTWPMRHASLYSAPFRIRQRAAGEVEVDLGEELTAAAALGRSGPLHAQGPGELTRWMALPWQGDTVFCRSGYEPEYDPYLPTFWPARVPNQVLSEKAYAAVMDPTRSREQRLAAFHQRDSWVRGLRGGGPEQILQMVGDFAAMGVLEARPGVIGDPELPAQMLVESLPAGGRVPPASRSQGMGQGTRRDGPPDRVAQAGWDSPEQLEEFRRIRLRR
jgi:hypothetical protein